MPDWAPIMNQIVAFSWNVRYTKCGLLMTGQLSGPNRRRRASVARTVICLWTRGVTRLDGTRSKKQVWRQYLNLRSFRRKCTVFEENYLWHCWDISATPAVILRRFPQLFRSDSAPHSDSVPGELFPCLPPRSVPSLNQTHNYVPQLVQGERYCDDFKMWFGPNMGKNLPLQTCLLSFNQFL